ncbi:hypothetical protein GCM10009835_41520 [Planosporangium flavigriseum]|uniref:Uncharacterized protein n=1 Tax=Planosporangium flavigriseum TaxID=373681 RepID=A0A8J3LJR3_9ACTN|nr:hypothetical protein Pfl04_23210 [Planosporangium flavigriseum]
MELARPWWAPWRPAEMDRETVVSTLEPLLEEAAGLRRAAAPGSVDELNWDGRCVGTQWSVYSGGSGITRVSVDMWEERNRPDGPADEYLDEAVMVLRRMRELARATGARLFIDEGDFTDAPFENALDALT